MMLWDLIRDFFVTYIFGGITSSGAYYFGYFGRLNNGANLINVTTSDNYIPFNLFDGNYTISLGDYLSNIATIITLVIILLVIGHFIKKTFNLFGRII